MNIRTLGVFACIAAAATLPVHAANLLINPGNEEALVAGEIPGWTEVVGTNWTQRSLDPVAFEGGHYFFAGAGPSATLRQSVDVSSFGTSIDAGLGAIAFSGQVRSWPQSPADTSNFELSFLDGSGAVLAATTLGPYSNTTQWTLIAANLIAPALTRTVQVDLISIRFAGTNNDGYFDDLTLQVSAVPEPSSAALLAAGLALILWRRRG